MGVPQFNQPIGGFGSGRHRQASAQVRSGAYQSTHQAQQARAYIAQQMAAHQNALLTQALLTGSGCAGYEPVEESTIENTGVQVGEVIAWRTWRIENGWLYSMTMNEVEWEPGKIMEAHKVGPVLGDGIHAFKTRKRAFDYTRGGLPVAIGRVALWGQIYEFEKGWHGEFARVYSIDAVIGVTEPQPPRRRWFRKPGPPQPTALQQLQSAYNVPGV